MTYQRNHDPLKPIAEEYAALYCASIKANSPADKRRTELRLMVEGKMLDIVKTLGGSEDIDFCIHPADIRKSFLIACIGDRHVMVTAEQAYDPEGKRFVSDGQFIE